MNTWDFKKYKDIDEKEHIVGIRKGLELGEVIIPDPIPKDASDWDYLYSNYRGWLDRNPEATFEVVKYPNNIFKVPPPPPTLEESKQIKINQIDIKTQELIQLGFDFDDSSFSMSAMAQLNWASLGAARANGMLSFPLSISTVDESAYELKDDGSCLQFLGAYMIYQVDPTKPLSRGRILKSQVGACVTVEEVEAITDTR